MFQKLLFLPLITSKTTHKNGWKEIGRDFLSGKGDAWQETIDLTEYSKFTRITRLKLVYNLRKT